MLRNLLVVKSAYFLNEYSTLLSCSMGHTLFNDVARKFMLRESKYFTPNTAD